MTTLNDIKRQVLQRCNMEYSNFIGDDEFLDMINSSFAELYEELVSKYGEDYFATETTFTLGSGAYTQALPADFFKVLSVEIFECDGYIHLHRWSYRDRDRYHHPFEPTTPHLVRYKTQGNNLRFYPETVAGNHTYRLAYVPRFQAHSALTETVTDLDLQNWHEYVIADTCIKVMGKQGTDASLFIGQKAELKQRIQKHAANRDAGEVFELGDEHDEPFLGIYGLPRGRW